MRCPRCYAKMPDEAANCVDCRLPRPKGAATLEMKPDLELDTEAILEESQPDAIMIEAQPTNPPRPIYAEKITPVKAQLRVRPTPVRPTRKPRANRKRLFVLAGVPLIVTLLGAVVYLYVLPALKPEQIETQSAVMAVSRFRQMPSNEAGMTVDERMSKELERSRLNGSLRGYQGWTYKAVKGEKMKVLVVFSFDQANNTQQRAEWLA